MAKAIILEIDSQTRRIENLGELDLASIPTKDDKVVIDIGNKGYVFKVIDVLYADQKGVDVVVVRVSTVTDYNAHAYGDVE